MTQYACEKCGHEWPSVKAQPPKKCPRCQASFSSGRIHVVEFHESMAAANPYAKAVSEILATGAEPWASTIRGIVDAYRATSAAAAPAKPSRKVG